MRKMADKLGHITSPRPASAGANSPSSPSAPHSVHMLPQSQSQPPHSPSASLSSAQSTALSSTGQRPSASTGRTSLSEWKGNGQKEGKTDQMDVDAQPEPIVPLQARRPTGMYRLSDFIIQRTLGTGSFGRVHLGMSTKLYRFASTSCYLSQCEASTTSVSTLSRSSAKKRSFV